MTADLHVDPYGSRRDAETGLNAIMLDRIRTLRWIGEKARELDCDALIVAGDYVESKTNPRSGRVTRIAQALEAGPTRQIHFAGNHDIADVGLSIVDDLATRSPSWTGYTQPAVEMIGDIAIVAIPHLAPAWLRTQPGYESIPDAEIHRALSEHYLAIARGLYAKAEKAGARAVVLSGHQQLAGGLMSETQRVFLGDLDTVVDPGALATIGYAAVVFGHVHKGQTLIDGPCPVAFVGSSERTDFAEEPDLKSFVIVDIDEAGRAAIERIPTPARRWLTLRGAATFVEAAVEDAVVRGVDLDPDVDEADLRRALYAAGALEVMGLRRRPVVAAAAVGGLSETLSPVELLEAYFEGDPDRDALVAMGRRILEAVA